jgi:1-acyl-sn-glycerol-3-phosphate acyltransferase
MSIYYNVGRYPSRWILRTLARVDVEGVEHIPDAGPFALVPNHQSLMDPMLVQAFCPRPVHSMTKSTQFASPFFRWLIPRLHGFPVRRYRIDPQAVRVLLRYLDQGRGVCVYPEGERTWDGEIQDFRRGALRVLLRSGVPIVPVGVSGMFNLWPRWRSKPRVQLRPRLHVRIRYGPPLEPGAHTDRDAREAALPAFSTQLRAELERLSR